VTPEGVEEVTTEVTRWRREASSDKGTIHPSVSGCAWDVELPLHETSSICTEAVFRRGAVEIRIPDEEG